MNFVWRVGGAHEGGSGLLFSNAHQELLEHAGSYLGIVLGVDWNASVRLLGKRTYAGSAIVDAVLQKAMRRGCLPETYFEPLRS